MIFQEPMTSLNPVFTHRRADRRDRCACTRAWTARPRAPRRMRMLELVEIPAAAQRLRRVPAPALGRHAPARDDRDGDGLRPDAADRRRADHRARRDDPGADPRADAAAAGRDRHEHPVHHAQPRRRRGARRRRGGDVRRPRRRDARRCGELFARPQHPYTQGLLACLPGQQRGVRPRQTARRLLRDPRPGVEPARAAARLRVRAALRPGRGRVPRSDAGRCVDTTAQARSARCIRDRREAA